MSAFYFLKYFLRPYKGNGVVAVVIEEYFWAHFWFVPRSVREEALLLLLSPLSMHDRAFSFPVARCMFLAGSLVAFVYFCIIILLSRPKVTIDREEGCPFYFWTHFTFSFLSASLMLCSFPVCLVEVSTSVLDLESSKEDSGLVEWTLGVVEAVIGAFAVGVSLAALFASALWSAVISTVMSVSE